MSVDGARDARDVAAIDHPRSFDAFAEVMHQVAPDLDDQQIHLLMRYRDALYEKNKVVNLTAVRDYDGVERRLILESLRLRDRVRELSPDTDARIMDLGSGGGIPGMVLAIAIPEARFVLLDATGKKVKFLQECVDALKLANTTTLHGRAEDLGHDIDWRNQFDVVTARAVTSLSALLELGLPFVRHKGWSLLPKGIDIGEEMTIARKAAGKLGGTLVEAPILPPVGSLVETRLVLVRKDLPTPSSYPRRAGVPAKNPLGTGQDRPDPTVRRGKAKRK